MALRNSSESPILSSSAIVVFPPFGRLVSSEETTRWPSSSTAYSNFHTHADTTPKRGPTRHPKRAERIYLAPIHGPNRRPERHSQPFSDSFKRKFNFGEFLFH